MGNRRISDNRDMAFRMIDSEIFRKGEEIRSKWVLCFCEYAEHLQSGKTEPLSDADFLLCKGFADLNTFSIGGN